MADGSEARDRAERIVAHARARRAEAQRRAGLGQASGDGAVREHDQVRDRAAEFAADARMRYQRVQGRPADPVTVNLDLAPSVRRRLDYFDVDFCLTVDRPEMLTALLDAALALTSAERGNVQLYDASADGLRIAAQRGFEREFLDFFAFVGDDRAACGAAMATGHTVAVFDVAGSPVFDTGATRDVVLDAGVRAVRSMPLHSPDGRLLGVFSVHFGRRYRADASEQRLLAMLADSASRRLCHPWSGATDDRFGVGRGFTPS